MSNIIYLDDYRKEVLEEETELRNPILLGWDEDESLYIASTDDTEECLCNNILHLKIYSRNIKEEDV